MERVAAGCLPVLVGAILLAGLVKGVSVFQTFIQGAKEGLRASVGILPTLLGLILAVTVMRASGLLELLGGLFGGVMEGFGLSPDLVPLALLRPISGGGATAYTADLLARVGPDSLTGKVASVLAASTETTFYAITVYFGAVGVRRVRWGVPAALLGDLTAVALSILTVLWMG